jgi:hypothetical protein
MEIILSVWLFLSGIVTPPSARYNNDDPGITTPRPARYNNDDPGGIR